MDSAGKPRGQPQKIEGTTRLSRPEGNERLDRPWPPLAYKNKPRAFPFAEMSPARFLSQTPAFPLADGPAQGGPSCKRNRVISSSPTDSILTERRRCPAGW